MVAAASCLPLASQAQADKATINALERYFDLVDANAGTIQPEQIPSEDYNKFYVLDVRDAARCSTTAAAWATSRSRQTSTACSRPTT